VIDELLPEVTTEALAALMQRDEEQRPVEGISWELKSEVSKNRIPRTVCAFANTLGGILILGAREHEFPTRRVLTQPQGRATLDVGPSPAVAERFQRLDRLLAA
jgi:Schlafen, AlbA_2